MEETYFVVKFYSSDTSQKVGIMKEGTTEVTMIVNSDLYKKGDVVNVTDPRANISRLTEENYAKLYEHYKDYNICLPTIESLKSVGAKFTDTSDIISKLVYPKG